MSHDHDHPHPHPHEPADGRVRFTGVRPILSVVSVPASLAYYREQLGFEQCWAWSDEQRFDHPTAPTFAQVMRGELVLHLAQQDQGGAGMWIYVDLASLADLAALHHEYQHSGARVVAPPADRPWGMREMLVQDLDGHTLRLGAALDHE